MNSHGVARDIGENNSARSAARAAGQAIAAHVARHSYGAALYGQQAVFSAVKPSEATISAANERDWQFYHLLKLK